MKALTHYFTNKNILFKELEAITPKAIGSRKKINIYSGTGVDNNYYAIFIITSKSRFLRKQAQELLELIEKLAHFKEHNFKKKILLISSDVCSKAKLFLQDNGWKVNTIDEKDFC